jgi:hypothetical protein
MEVNRVAVNQLIDERFNGNKAEFARAIGVERSQVSLIINTGRGAGAKFYGGLIAYCEREGLDYKNYIIITDDEQAATTA